MGSKTEMLARIREALGALPQASPEYPPDLGASSSAGDRWSLVNQFRSELERVGGKFNTVNSSAEIEEYVLKLLPEPRERLVAVSDGAASQEPGIRSRLLAEGAKLIPSLAEFAAADADLKDDRAAAADLGLMERYKRLLFDACLGITCADFGIADTGTLVIASDRRVGNNGPNAGTLKRPESFAEQHRLISLVPPVHVCLLNPSRIVGSLREFFPRANRELYPGQASPLVMTFITGPSRTADIELSLTMGVHGPRDLHVLVYDSQ